MQGRISSFRVVLALVLWVGILTGAGYYAGEQWLHSLGGEVCAIIGAWLGSILGLIHVLLTLMRSRPVT